MHQGFKWMGWFLGDSTVVVSGMLVQQEQSTFKNSMVL
jgi:hypothetical protein